MMIKSKSKEFLSKKCSMILKFLAAGCAGQQAKKQQEFRKQLALLAWNFLILDSAIFSRKLGSLVNFDWASRFWKNMTLLKGWMLVTLFVIKISIRQIWPPRHFRSPLQTHLQYIWSKECLINMVKWMSLKY